MVKHLEKSRRIKIQAKKKMHKLFDLETNMERSIQNGNTKSFKLLKEFCKEVKNFIQAYSHLFGYHTGIGFSLCNMIERTDNLLSDLNLIDYRI